MNDSPVGCQSRDLLPARRRGESILVHLKFPSVFGTEGYLFNLMRDSDGERRFALLRCGKPEKILAGR